MKSNLSIDLPPDSGASEQSEIERLRAAVDRLQRELRDQQFALSMANEHDDSMQEYLYRLSTSLKAEVRERQAAEDRLQKIVKAISKEKGDLEVLVQILVDEGDRASEENEEARIDGLTRIANRRRFDEFLAKEMERHARLAQPLSLLICDVDHFKLYNDLYGHPAGDKCLKAVARAIDRQCRKSGLVARYGGEEFGVVLPNTTLEAASNVAERTRKVVAGAALPHAASPVCDHITLSIGVACKTPDMKRNKDVCALIEEADRNLYLAKHHGRNRVCRSEERASRTL